jgi:L-alanine-DL-glutamate epimerase-like enolase superfamily enzyme
MNAGTHISDILVEKLDLPLVEPFVIATGTRPSARNVLVKLFLDDGTVGYGEVSPPTQLSDAAQDDIIRFLREIVPDLRKRPLQGYQHIIRDIRSSTPDVHGAISGLEIALFDAAARAAGVPLHKSFGGKLTDIQTDMTISIKSPERTNELARDIVQRGFETIKMKVGLDMEGDVERVVAVSQIAPEAGLILDANQGYGPEEAVEFARRLLERGVRFRLFEQPVAKEDLAGLKHVTDRSGVPVAADESVVTPEDAKAIIAARAAHVINIKVAKSGLLGALAIMDMATKARVGLMIGGMLESKIGISASVHLACGSGLFTFCDLDTIYLLKPYEVTGGFAHNGPVYSVQGITRGTGIEL